MQPQTPPYVCLGSSTSVWCDKRLKVLQISDAVQQICILVKHQLVTLVQNRQEPPPCFQPVPDVEPLEQNPLGFVSPATLERAGALLLGELNQVFPVLKASEFHHNEQIVGAIGVR